MPRILPALVLTLFLASSGCAMSISKDGFHAAFGDSSVATEKTQTTGGSISESFASLLENLAKLVPFANPSAPEVNVVVPGPENESEAP